MIKIALGIAVCAVGIDIVSIPLYVGGSILIASGVISILRSEIRKRDRLQ